MSWTIVELERTLLIGSTLVEGSTLTVAEAKDVLAGKTVQGHPVEEIRELLNYRSAVEWIMALLKQTPYLSQDLIQGFHQKMFQNFSRESGKWKTNRNYTYLTDGSRFEYASPAQVPHRMAQWIEHFNAAPKDIKEAAILYFDFQCIHPFEDGNGRVGRVLLAYWLHWKLNRPFHFYLKDKTEHLTALESAGRGDLAALNQFIKRRAIRKKSVV